MFPYDQKINSSNRTGDTELAQRFDSVLSDLDVDWEEQLADQLLQLDLLEGLLQGAGFGPAPAAQQTAKARRPLGQHQYRQVPLAGELAQLLDEGPALALIVVHHHYPGAEVEERHTLTCVRHHVGTEASAVQRS